MNNSYKELYLKHHGIQGQRWGKRNGPPYPLVPYRDYSKAEKKHLLKAEKKVSKIVEKHKKESDNIDKKYEKKSPKYPEAEPFEKTQLRKKYNDSLTNVTRHLKKKLKDILSDGPSVYNITSDMLNRKISNISGKESSAEYKDKKGNTIKVDIETDISAAKIGTINHKNLRNVENYIKQNVKTIDENIRKKISEHILSDDGYDGWIRDEVTSMSKNLRKSEIQDRLGKYVDDSEKTKHGFVHYRITDDKGNGEVGYDGDALFPGHIINAVVNFMDGMVEFPSING